MPGGVTEAGYREYHDLKRQGEGAKIATVIASNSGRPGGACRAPDGSLDVEKIHANHTTQEADVISNWLIAETREIRSDDDRRAVMSILFEPVSNAFGLMRPNGTDFKTKQGVDYTKGEGPDITSRGSVVKGPRVYADAWRYEGATMCAKKVGTNGAAYDTSQTYETTLVFCAAPNAQDPDGSKRRRSKESSMRRTYSVDANKNRMYFYSGVAWAVYTALYASALAGCDTVFLPFVGGGIYAGPHKGSLRIDKFKDVVDIMLTGGGITRRYQGSRARKVLQARGDRNHRQTS